MFSYLLGKNVQPDEDPEKLTPPEPDTPSRPLPGERIYEFTEQVKEMLIPRVLVPLDIIHIVEYKYKIHNLASILTQQKYNPTDLSEGTGVILDEDPKPFRRHYPEDWETANAIKLDHYLKNTFTEQQLNELKVFVKKIIDKILLVDPSNFQELNNLKKSLENEKLFDELFYYHELKEPINDLIESLETNFVTKMREIKRDEKDESPLFYIHQYIREVEKDDLKKRHKGGSKKYKTNKYKTKKYKNKKYKNKKYKT